MSKGEDTELLELLREAGVSVEEGVAEVRVDVHDEAGLQALFDETAGLQPAEVMRPRRSTRWSWGVGLAAAIAAGLAVVVMAPGAKQRPAYERASSPATVESVTDKSVTGESVTGKSVTGKSATGKSATHQSTSVASADGGEGGLRVQDAEELDEDWLEVDDADLDDPWGLVPEGEVAFGWGDESADLEG